MGGGERIPCGASHGGESIRWATWNLWAVGPDLERRTDLAREQLLELAPDLCCLQEVRADDSIDVAEELGRSLGLHVGRGDPMGAGWWSARVGRRLRVDNLVLSRWPIEEISTTSLPGLAGGAEQRGATQVRVTAPGGALRVVSTQLTSSPIASVLRCSQIEHLARSIADHRRGDETVLVAGDLNAEPDSDEVRRLCGHKTAPAVDGFVLLDLWRFAGPDQPHWTWDAANIHVARTREPSSRIDYLLAGPTPTGLLPEVLSIRRFAGPERSPSDAPSDHCGVVADLRL